MNTIMQNHKTTVGGALMILAALLHAAQQSYAKQPVDMPTLFSAVSGGIALIMAKDGSTHSTADQVSAATEKAKN